MSYKNPEADNVTKYHILSRQSGLANKEIRMLTGCAKSEATRIINKIHCEMLRNKQKPSPRRVSRYWFCTYMQWDWEEIKAFALAEIACRQSQVSA